MRKSAKTGVRVQIPGLPPNIMKLNEIANMTKKMYHVTREEYMSAINRQGLTPKIGELSAEIGEHGDKKAVYLFPTLDDVKDALSNWMADWYEEKGLDDIKLLVLEVTLPPEFPVEKTFEGKNSWEWVSYQTIPVQYITKVMDENMLAGI